MESQHHPDHHRYRNHSLTTPPFPLLLFFMILSFPSPILHSLIFVLPHSPREHHRLQLE
jgi:hypothetical protein